jgi:hypothetical protein
LWDREAAFGLARGLWISTKKSFIASLLARSETSSETGIPGGLESTPPPYARERLVWRGFCKHAAQNLEPQGFRGQNLDFKELIGGAFRLHSIFFASTMMGLFPIRHKVRCHIEAGTPVEISRRATLCR